MKPIPKKKPLASLEWETTKNGEKFNWKHIQNFKTGVPLTDQELKEFGVNGFTTPMPEQPDTFASSEKPKKPKHPYHANTPQHVLGINHTLGGLKKKKKTNKRRRKRKQTKKRRRNT